jgi:hypothetical protein
MATVVLRVTGKRTASLFSVLCGSVISVQLFSVFIIPKIERHSQGALIDFVKEKAREDCHMNTIGFKSYAYLFYGEKMPDDLFLTAEETDEPEYGMIDIRERTALLHSAIDKPVYFISKIQHKNSLLDEKRLELIGEKNGYVFWKRSPAM